jgi:hypothetical protein
LARWLLGLGIAATPVANVAHGLGVGPGAAGAVVAASSEVELVGLPWDAPGTYPGANSRAGGPRWQEEQEAQPMKYLVTMTTHGPDGTSGEAVADARAREAAHTSGLDVALNRSVPSCPRYRAAATARRVHGVTSVRNDLMVILPPCGDRDVWLTGAVRRGSQRKAAVRPGGPSRRAGRCSR